MIIYRLLKISGKVQGVFYRASAKQIADELKVKGWIRNTGSGNVEAFVTGEELLVEQFINWCKQGPPMADVKEIIVEECSPEYVSGYEIRR